MAQSKLAKEINILLLGETGVGKSTFINAFANYLSYETLEEAEKGKTICLIPTRFVISDENYEQQSVQYGYENDHVPQPEGESDTRQCTSYCFEHNEFIIRMIDTPGIGDTRGLEQDKKNFDHILSFIAEYQELHLICILMKPDMQRLTNSFNYCLTQLLLQLQKEASENIVFIFTNTRATFYRPRNTLVLLKQLLGEIKNRPPYAIIPIEKKTIYCYDNDSFQLLIAMQNKIFFSDEEKSNYAISWKKSVTECTRMLDYISMGKEGEPLSPHLIQNTLTVNDTRRIILTLNKSIAIVSRKIEENIVEIHKTKKDIEDFNGNIKDYLEQHFLSNKNHTGIFDIINLVFLYYKEAKNEQTVRDSRILKEKILFDLYSLLDDYIQERKKILETCAKLALFIKKYSIVAYKDCFEFYLFECSNLVETKSEAEMSNFSKILKDYNQEKRLLKEMLRNGKLLEANISCENINCLLNELYKLKETGKEIENLHNKNKIEQSDNIKKEIVHSVKPFQVKRIFHGFKS